MRKRFAYLGIVSSLAVGLAAYGCGGNGTGDGKTTGSTGDGGSGNSAGNSSGGNGGAGGDGGCVFNCSGSGGSMNMADLIISPMDPVLNVVDTTIPTQAFTVKTKDGTDVTANVQWIYDRPDIGDMTNETFTPTGNVGGVGVLTVRYNAYEATTNVSVIVKKTNNQAGVGAAEIMAFDNPTLGADPGTIVYPYNETVFPLGVLAPEVQINNVQDGVYRIKIHEKYLEYVTYFNATMPVRHLIDQTAWANIGASGGGSKSDPIKVEISRLQGGQAYAPMTQNWHIAQGKVRGIVYYWELPGACVGAPNEGKILKIRPDSSTPEEFYNPGVCWGCHTVSRDGTTMMANVEKALPVPQITLDLTQAPVTVGSIDVPQGLAGTFGAFNDSGNKLLVSNDFLADDNAGKILRIVDAANGTVLNSNAMGAGCIEPAWSPDGKKLSAICGATTITMGDSWGFDSPTGNLMVADVGTDGFTVSNVKQIVAQNSGQGRPAYPSFTSDSAYIAFGRPTDGSRSRQNGDIWLVKPDGTESKKLATISSDNKSFNPVFAPQRAGGYYWLVFISRRDYGNTLVGTDRQQLWMAAIDDPPTAADPSHPPFYMRGQLGCGKSENAYMAPEPCRNQGDSCNSGIDCCAGQCVKDPANPGMYICGEPPPPGMCSELGNGCKVAADCCSPSALCIDGYCQLPVPP